jgi:pantoate--beta-alanine ligase
MTTPVLASTRAELSALLAPARAAGERVALVPTMGALHEGHASLMAEARRRTTGPVVVSIFVNPTQFAPGEDLDRYPRTLPEDLLVCEKEGVDVVFAPAVDEVYPFGPGEGVTVDPGALATILEGEVRPTHFRGVLTVVAKLFGLVRPDVAVFGQKDYQQLTLVRRMVSDLCMGIEVVGAETIRESGGLALSSRNRYLSADERTLALALSRALRAGVEAGPHGAGAVLTAARVELGNVELDYLELVSPDLGPVPESGEARLLVAAKVGSTRLIDNTGLDLGTDGDHYTPGSN